MSDTIYCYPDSDVLMNKMDIRDQAKLEEAERRLTMFRMSDLLDTPVKGDFDRSIFRVFTDTCSRIFIPGQPDPHGRYFQGSGLLQSTIYRGTGTRAVWKTKR